MQFEGTFLVGNLRALTYAKKKKNQGIDNYRGLSDFISHDKKRWMEALFNQEIIF